MSTQLAEPRPSAPELRGLPADPAVVAIVVPCCNEEPALEHLAERLRALEQQLGGRWEPQFIFVDDGSTDRTAARLLELFGGRPNCRIIRHVRNRGIAAAIRTGLRAARTEIVCSIDADCTYDPCELERMIPLLADGVDLVTGSPYHPLGRVENVPGWRLRLSRGLSAAYRRLLGSRLHTFTSCFRVYRKSAVQCLPLREEGFLGTAELIVRLMQAGGRVVEYPAVLRVREYGQSKMNVCRAIAAHLRFLARLLVEKFGRAACTRIRFQCTTND